MVVIVAAILAGVVFELFGGVLMAFAKGAEKAGENAEKWLEENLG